jgi:hypothetical protein
MRPFEFGTVLGSNDLAGARNPQAPAARASYDNRSGSALLRRSGKAAPFDAPLRGDQRSARLASRRKPEVDDRAFQQLRDYYQALLREPVPERLTALVEALAAGKPPR